MLSYLICIHCGAVFSDPGTGPRFEVHCPYCGISHYTEVERYRLDGSEVRPHGPTRFRKECRV